MIEITKKIIERAMLVALDTKEYNKEVVEEHLAELEELADTAGAETIFKIIQSKSKRSGNILKKYPFRVKGQRN